MFLDKKVDKILSKVNFYGFSDGGIGFQGDNPMDRSGMIGSGLGGVGTSGMFGSDPGGYLAAIAEQEAKRKAAANTFIGPDISTAPALSPVPLDFDMAKKLGSLGLAGGPVTGGIGGLIGLILGNQDYVSEAEASGYKNPVVEGFVNNDGGNISDGNYGNDPGGYLRAEGSGYSNNGGDGLVNSIVNGGGNTGTTTGSTSGSSGSIAEQLFGQTAPIRNSVIDQLTKFMQGDFDISTSPMFAGGKETIEDQYQVARDNIIGNIPTGGELNERLAGADTSRAKDFTSLISDIQNDMFNKSISTGFGTTDAAVSAQNTASQIAANQSLYTQNQNFQEDIAEDKKMGEMGMAAAEIAFK